MANSTELRNLAASLVSQTDGVSQVLNAVADAIDAGSPVVIETFADFWAVKTAGGIGSQPMTQAEAEANAAAFQAQGVAAEAVHVITASIA